MAFLNQAASHIAKYSQSDAQKSSGVGENNALTPGMRAKTIVTQPRYLVNQMKGVSRKSVIRLHKDTKRSICKRCDELLAEDKVDREIENKSINKAKPWADVLVLKCRTCGTSKRFPIGATRLQRSSASEGVSSAEAAPSS